MEWNGGMDWNGMEWNGGMIVSTRIIHGSSINPIA